ncbi:MAG: hypothetical protein JSU66_01565 [Deltaproteobacteria bacterium]|nr:MAG: hypothetical protein JSU66_01565 [Deltaproteobacteria bacterium]
MHPTSKAAIYCLAFLVAAELLLRVLDPTAREISTRWLDGRETVSFVLGTSRTLRSVDPRAVEAALEESGVAGAWVANLSQKGATTIGLHRHYMRTIHPIAARIPKRGVVAIEVRGAGLNDSYFPPSDRAYVPSRDAAGGRLAAVSAAGIDGLSRHALQQLAIVRARDWILRSWAGTGDAPDVPRWAQGRKGWEPFARPRPPDLRAAFQRDRYQRHRLHDFRLGGIQTEYLVRLVRQIRSDGFRPVAYLLPVTDIHRGFYAAGQYAEFLEHVADVADRERFPFVDLDSGHGYGDEAFFDTHHLAPESAAGFSRRFAEAVVLPHVAPSPGVGAVVAGGGRGAPIRPGAPAGGR